MACQACELAISGDFRFPRLARLEPTDMRLAEQLILAGGNLTLLAAEQGVSYPTLRKRLDRLIENLRMLQEADAREHTLLLEKVERREMRPEHAARLIRESSGGS